MLEINAAMQDDIGETALIPASANGHTDIVKVLLQHGAAVDHLTKVENVIPHNCY